MPKKISGTLGPRYGFSVRKRYAEVMMRRRAKYSCPRCYVGRLKRLSVGLWKCRKCGFTFAGGAYEPYTKSGQSSIRISSIRF